MASLTQTAILSRKVIRYSIYAIIGIIIARFLFKGAASLRGLIFPPKEEPPNVKFGNLPKLLLIEKYQKEDLEYVLETADGKLPQVPNQINVYTMVAKKAAHLNSLEDAKAVARMLGYDAGGKRVVENVDSVYRFTNLKVPSTLVMNIVSGVFSINYDVNSNPAVLNNIPLAPEAAVSFVKNYLGGAQLLSDDIKDGVSSTQFLRLEGGKYVPAISLSEADLIKVNLFRKSLNDILSVTPDYPEANIWFLLSGSGGKDVIEAEYNYFAVNEEEKATYPIMTSERAWERLNKGEAYIANPGTNKGSEIKIRRVYLAYYDPGQYVDYYQPVFVFQGDYDFYAYVPAIDDQYYQSEAE